MIWHSDSISKVLQELGVSRDEGLTNAQADERTDRYGANVPPVQETHNFSTCLKAAFHNPGMQAMLIAAVGIIAFSIYRTSKGHPTDWSLMAVMIVATLIYAGVVAALRYFAEKRLVNVTSHAATAAKVLRDGKWYSTTADRLVPGDIIRLYEGDLVPADCRILESYSLLCDETVLTGDTIPVAKAAGENLSNITPLKKRTNMVYAGCMVVLGSAEAVVVETGGDTELNRQQLLQMDSRRYLPHQEALGKTGRAVTAVAVCGALLSFAGAMVCQDRYNELVWSDMFMTAAAIMAAAAAVTLGIPALTAITATVKRLERRGVLVQHLDAVEKIGHAHVIVLDRFSILTEDAFTMKDVYTGETVMPAPTKNPDQAVASLVQLATLCSRDNDANDPMDAAIAQYAKKIGMDTAKLHGEFPRMGVIPSSASRHCMTAIHLISGKNVAILKGDPTEVIPHCTDANAEQIAELTLSMEKRGERVLAVAYRYLDEVTSNPTAEDIENDMIFVGLLGLASRPRPKAEKALFECADAGITTLLITGDSLAMATASAKSIGLIDSDDEAFDGVLLADMSDDDIMELLRTVRVISRPAADDRSRIVRALQKRGATVIMTGDDARDLAAMKEADISVAIGDCEDVAKVGADIIIPDGRFETLRYTVRASRGMMTSMRKATGFRVAASVGIVMTELLGLLFGGCLLLSPLMLLLCGLLVELVFAPALAAEKAEWREMHIPPRLAHLPVLNILWMLRSIAQGLVMAIGPAVVFAVVGITTGDWNNLAVSQAALTFLLTLAVQGFVFRASIPSAFAPFNWRWPIALAVTVVLAILLATIPAQGAGFGVTDGSGWAIILAATLVPALLTDIIKSVLALFVGSKRESSELN